MQHQSRLDIRRLRLLEGQDALCLGKHALQRVIASTMAEKTPDAREQERIGVTMLGPPLLWRRVLWGARPEAFSF